jgi:hypothetical protein
VHDLDQDERQQDTVEQIDARGVNRGFFTVTEVVATGGGAAAGVRPSASFF